MKAFFASTQSFTIEIYFWKLFCINIIIFLHYFHHWKLFHSILSLKAFFAPYYFWKLFCSILFSNAHTFLTLFHCILHLIALISFKNLFDILLSIAPHIFNSRSSQFLPPNKANSAVTALDLIIQGRPPLVRLTGLWL